MKRKILALMLIISMFICSCGKSSTNSSEYETKGESSNEKDVFVVSFESITTDGGDFSSEEFKKSKLTMINVWATYCSPCLKEMPDLGEIASNYDSKDFQIIGIVSDVSTNSSNDDVAYAKKLIKETKANYPHLLLSESIYANLVAGVDAVPTTFFVNENGELLNYVVGANGKSGWEGIIDELLDEVNQ